MNPEDQALVALFEGLDTPGFPMPWTSSACPANAWA